MMSRHHGLGLRRGRARLCSVRLQDAEKQTTLGAALRTGAWAFLQRAWERGWEGCTKAAYFPTHGIA